MVSRVAFLDVPPDRVDDVQQVVRDVVDAGLRGADGYVGYLVLGDRATGKVIGITLWESEEAEAQATRKLPICGPRSSKLPVGRCAQSRDTKSSTTCGTGRGAAGWCSGAPGRPQGSFPNTGPGEWSAARKVGRVFGGRGLRGVGVRRGDQVTPAGGHRVEPLLHLRQQAVCRLADLVVELQPGGEGCKFGFRLTGQSISCGGMPPRGHHGWGVALIDARRP